MSGPVILLMASVSVNEVLENSVAKVCQQVPAGLPDVALVLASRKRPVKVDGATGKWLGAIIRDDRLVTVVIADKLCPRNQLHRVPVCPRTEPQYRDNRGAALEWYAAQEAYEAACAAVTIVQAYINAYNDGLMLWRDIPPEVRAAMSRMGY